MRAGSPLLVVAVGSAAVSKIACVPYGPLTGQSGSTYAFVALPPAPSMSSLGTSSSQRSGRGRNVAGAGWGGWPARSKNNSRPCTDRHVGLLRTHVGLDASATGFPRDDAASSCRKRVASAFAFARSTPPGHVRTTVPARDARRDDTTAAAATSSSPLACRCLSRYSALGATPAFAAAASYRGGGGDASSLGGDGEGIDVRPAVTAAVKGLNVGNAKQERLIIDRVEDVLSSVYKALVVVAVPIFHLARLSFGLCLLFYGMAFRTFAFHVIVFRIAGLKQVQRAVKQVASTYVEARKSIREAAEAAETVGERVWKGNTELNAAKERMIREKKRLLADGFLSDQETRYFMKKYNTELCKIKKEQDQFKSARSSVFSVRTSVDPKVARSSLSSVYNALITSFTASTIQSAGQITLGFHVGSLLKTHILDMFGPILDPIGYRLDLTNYYEQEDIPYMGKANAMDGPQNLALNILCYSTVFVIFRVHPAAALKASMVYYGARVVTDYVTMATEPARRKLKQMTIKQTPWEAVIHAGLTALGFCYHRNVLHTAGVTGFHPLIVGPGVVGLVEPLVRFAVKLSDLLADIEFFRCQFVEDPVEAVKNIGGQK